MGITDPIGDMLTSLRNANMAKKEKVDIPSSILKMKMLDILKREGFIRNYRVLKEKSFHTLIRVYLKFSKDRQSAITGLKRISKPGLRVYAKKTKIPKVRGGMGITILSTSKGIVTDKEAKEYGVGGEALCTIW